MHESVRAVFCAFSTQFEGRVPWMYQDIRGLVTVGVGNLIEPLEQALLLPFVNKHTGLRASAAAIRAEWNQIKSVPELARRGHRACEALTELRLTHQSIDALVHKKLNQDARLLSSAYPEWESWPADAQLGVLSMSWALGPAFPRRWPKFSSACRRRSWGEAALYCRIRDADNPGLRPRNAANVQLFENALVVEQLELDPATLCYPNRPSSPDSARFVFVSETGAAASDGGQRRIRTSEGEPREH